VRKAYGTVHIDAAQHDYASSHPTEDVHQFFRLRPLIHDWVDHGIGSNAQQFLSIGVELVTVAPNLVHARGRGRRVAVKHGQLMALLLQRGHDELPDEPIFAN
jgi:hypothetical protein